MLPQISQGDQGDRTNQCENDAAHCQVVYPGEVSTSSTKSDSRGSRWAVILVQLPDKPERLNPVLPRSRPVKQDDLPLVTRVTHALEAAHETAARLRGVGARVVIVEEPIDREGSAFCSDHPAQLAARVCKSCHTSICPGCMVDGGGHPICKRCRLKKEQAIRSTRRRQLFLTLVFVAFLYKVWQHIETDAEQVQGSAPITIGIMQFAPKADVSANIIRTLNQGPVEQGRGFTFRDLSSWFNTEYTRYTGNKDQRFRIESRGPFGVDINPPPLVKEGDTWFTRMFRAFRYPRYFRQLALDSGLPVDSYAVKVYVVYGGTAFDMASHSRGSEKGRVAVVYVSLDETNPGYPLATMAHEIGHALGASDSYDTETSQSIHPYGYIEPFADPLYPQPFAELMAVDIPLSPKREQEVGSLNQLRVGHRTAAEMGWIPPEQADLFYTPAELMPEDKLTPQPKPIPDGKDSG